MVEILKTKSNEIVPIEPWKAHAPKVLKPTSPLSKDTLTLLNVEEEEENERIKKTSSMPLLTSIPQLTPPTQLFDKNLASSKIDSGIENAKSVHENDSDSQLEKLTFQCSNELRNLLSEMIVIRVLEINKKQKERKLDQAEINQIRQEIIDRVGVSKVLEWVQAGATIALVALSATCFALSVATGGVSAVLGVLTAVAAGSSGVTGGVNQAIQLDTEKKQGRAKELQSLRTWQFEEINTLIADNQAALQKIHDLYMNDSQILSNRSRLKF